ncbi:head GIN domain-containing protein [Flammeovirgaceae bacterium SG7u.111]|nr:head GIN domain-containing protein [Flammeovirgaceae bacterium SG7u.132]WPO36355.1 head GIN domain-containing protein [Flammeovirgaceae bacterium SG7u.111]
MLIGLVMVIASCHNNITGEGEKITRDYGLTGFSSISSDMSADVYYSQSNDYLVKITAQPNILDVMEIEVKGSELKIGIKNGYNIKTHDGIYIETGSPEIFGFNLNGSGNITSADSVKTSDLNLTINGSGNFTFPTIKAEKVSCSIDGSGDLFLGGETGTNDIRINGSGNIKAFTLSSEASSIIINGSGDCEMWVEEDLDVDINGSGSVYYKGDPQIRINANGSGKVVKVD